METKAKKVLIADDEKDILEIISYNLTGDGYEIYTAKDAMKRLIWQGKYILTLSFSTL
jgi:two-component system alkaline phosphatase synthesis response regulator PhoP